MTTETRDKILSLRKQGMGYTMIAREIGESRDAVRYICRSRGLGGVGQLELALRGNVCPACGNGLSQPTGRGRRRRFCSEACRREWWAKHQPMGQKKATAFYHATCKHCGKDFTAYGNKTRIYCSRECYIQERFWT